MSLRSRIFEDVHRVFMNGQHFAETHMWNGVPIVCVPDEEEALKRANNNVNDISWDSNTREIVLYTPVDDFPGAPEPNTHVVLDKRRMTVLDVHEDMGMYTIRLTVKDAREIA